MNCGFMINDEDIPTILPFPPHDVDQQIAAKKKSNDEIRIGPITRARAKLIEQQVNLLLIDSDYFINENCLLPKSLCVCILRFMREEGIARGNEELKQLEQDMVIMHMDAREEREDGDQHEEEDTTQEATYGAPPSACAPYTYGLRA
ncbi:hypothetical protein VPH35_096715 [Triticum aestivum]